MPVFILTLSQVKNVNTSGTLLVFFIIHFLVYPASNGYNSYIDRDESPIGGLEKPPVPTKQLFYLTLILDLSAIFLAFVFIKPLFSVCILIYILASRAYSSRQVRLKKYPYIGFFTVVVFQGAFTFVMCSVGLSGQSFVLNYPTMLILLATSFQIAGAYPLTQIYQHKEDYSQGVITLSYKLGYRGTFVFTMLMFILCNVFYFLFFKELNQTKHFILLQVFFFPIVIYFMSWFLKVIKNKNEANFKNTMRMNTIAACCMNACFLVLFYLNN
ncbi:UbiA family prenyltransferase [Aurantibacillus circumpalustris]|uniref:UbiA family prenyltransferase n=1 Tax=Aurantibacillus circumpalustris TaxID=3036359 RepID=UPI00295BCE38|nr:UbiA family prenyltransferase [Aurantibacillus circumpalustris]